MHYMNLPNIFVCITYIHERKLKSIALFLFYSFKMKIAIKTRTQKDIILVIVIHQSTIIMKHYKKMHGQTITTNHPIQF